MKNRIFKLIAGASALAVFFMNGPVVCAAGGQQKNETVYIALNADGSMKTTTVVNSFQLAGGASGIVDFGDYLNVENLTDDAQIQNQNGSITIDSPGKDGMFYYQGELKNRELPWTFDIAYSLDGKNAGAADLVDAKGKTEIIINAKANGRADAYLKKSMILQVTLELPMGDCKNISAGDAACVVAGNKKTIVQSVLPGQDGMMAVSFDADGFTLPSIQMNMMEAAIPGIDGVDELTDGIGDLTNGMDDVISGSRELKDGLNRLADGSQDLADGAAEAAGNRTAMTDGAAAVQDALSRMNAGMPALQSGAASLSDGLNQVNGNMPALANGYAQSKQGLDAILANKDQLTLLVNGLIAAHPDPADPVYQLAAAMLSTLNGVQGVSDGMGTLNSGLSQAAGGISALVPGASQLSGGLGDLAGGMGQLVGNFWSFQVGLGKLFDGLDSLKSGSAELSGNTAGLPGNMQELIDGQQELKDGIAEMDESVNDAFGNLQGEDLEPVSFVAPGKVTPASVQFILTTPAAEEPKEEETPTERPKEQTFWDKLFALFQ